MTVDILGPGTLLGASPRILVGGEWVATERTRPVDNPATGAVHRLQPLQPRECVSDRERRWAHRLALAVT